MAGLERAAQLSTGNPIRNKKTWKHRTNQWDDRQDRKHPETGKRSRTPNPDFSEPKGFSDWVEERNQENVEFDYESKVGENWEPPRVIDHRTPGRHGVPTIDDDLDNDYLVAPVSYPDYNEADTFVISGTVGPFKAPSDTPGRRHFRLRKEAREWVLNKYGQILEEYRAPYKWMYRVYKPKAEPGKSATQKKSEEK